MKKMIFRFTILMLIVTSSYAFSSEKMEADTLKGYFIFYSSHSVNIDYHQMYSAILPLDVDFRKLAVDSFNEIISNSNKCLNFLNNNKKIFIKLDYADVKYLINRYALDSSLDEKLYSKELLLNNEKEKYQLMRYDSRYKNTDISIVLFEAEIVVVYFDGNFLANNCCVFKIEDNIICYADNINNKNCKGLAIIDLKIVGEMKR